MMLDKNESKLIQVKMCRFDDDTIAMDLKSLPMFRNDKSVMKQITKIVKAIREDGFNINEDKMLFDVYLQDSANLQKFDIAFGTAQSFNLMDIYESMFKELAELITEVLLKDFAEFMNSQMPKGKYSKLEN